MRVKLDAGAFLPVRSHSTDAGLDIFSPKDFFLTEQESIDTGVHVEIPSGYAGFIKSRSSMMAKGITTEGVIDCGYTGSIRVVLTNHDKRVSFNFHRGDKIAQLVILPCSLEGCEEVTELDETERGDGGFGSTDRH